MPSTPAGGPRTCAIQPGGDPDCDHGAVRELAGDAGANRYFRCRPCGGVLVREAPLQSEGSDADLCTVDPRFEDLLEALDHYHDRRSPSLLSRARTAVRRLLR